MTTPPSTPTSAKKSTAFRHFAVGTTVAIQDPFSAEIHTGTVTRVNVLKNGYPQTFVDFPTRGGEREWNVDTLRTPEALAAMIAERNQLFPQNTLRAQA